MINDTRGRPNLNEVDMTRLASIVSCLDMLLRHLLMRIQVQTVSLEKGVHGCLDLLFLNYPGKKLWVSTQLQC